MLTAKLLKMQNLEDEEELAYSPGLSRLVKLLYTVYTYILYNTYMTLPMYIKMFPYK